MGGLSAASLAIVPAEPDLAGAEIELVGLDRREYRLRDDLWATGVLQLRLLGGLHGRKAAGWTIREWANIFA